MEIGWEIGGCVNQLVLCCGCIGGDVEEADVEAVVDDEAFCELKERSEVAQACAGDNHNVWLCGIQRCCCCWCCQLFHGFYACTYRERDSNSSIRDYKC